MPTFNPRRIVFAVYKGVSLLDLAGPLEAFRVADAFSPSRNGRSMYECTVVSSRGGRVMTADGVELGTKPTRSLTRKAIDTVVVPGGFQVDDVTRDRALVQWIRNIAPAVSVFALFAWAASFWPRREFSTVAALRPTGCMRPFLPAATRQ